MRSLLWLALLAVALYLSVGLVYFIRFFTAGYRLLEIFSWPSWALAQMRLRYEGRRELAGMRAVAAGRLDGGSRDQADQFANQGTTRHELEIARILNQWLGRRIVEAVRLSNWNVGGAPELIACVDLLGGRTLPTVHVPRNMTARQHAEEIYQFIQSALRISGP